MSSKRVYFAKSNLANGSDVEYVKSNLLRIQGIDIVEWGKGSPDSCDALVIVGPESFDYKNKHKSKVTIGRGIYDAIEDFVQGFETREDAFDCIYVFTGKGESDQPFDLDCEHDTPKVTVVQGTELKNSTDYISYGKMFLTENYERDLLYVISVDMGCSSYYSWKGVPRHYKPSAEFAMPSFTKEELRGLPVSNKRSVYVQVEYNGPEQSGPLVLMDSNQSSGIPILSLRKGRR